MKKGLIVTVILAMVTMLAAGCAGTPSPAPAQTPEQTQATESTPAQKPEATTTSTPAPGGEVGAFRLLVSDEENAIDNFEQLWVNITNIGVHKGGDSENWIEPEDFEPVEVNLKQLIEDNATAIWSGFLEAGIYNKVFITVDNVTAVPEAEVMLPGDKMHISKQFEVADGEVTNFVYDITIIEAGKSDKYILKPQIGESGANIKFNEVKPDGKTKRYKEKNKEQNGEEHGNGEDQLQLELGGEIGLGMDVPLIVTEGESFVEGATISINEVELETKTDAGGSVTILLPTTPGEIEIKAVFEDMEGELKFELKE